MNVLLIWPKFDDNLFWRVTCALNILKRKNDHPPLGLITVAAVLPADWQKRLVDANIADLTENDIKWADIAFISAYYAQRDSARQLILRCKLAGKVVAGGPLFNWEHDDYNEVDHLVLNEAELTLPLFLKDLAQGTAAPIYTTNSFANLSDTPVPLFELLKLKQYACMNIQFSRGCPFDCEFCCIANLFGRKYRHKSSGQIIAELDKLYNLGWKGMIYFADDNFIGNKKYLKSSLLPELIDWRSGKKDLLFQTEASIDLADDPQLIDLMVKAGFDTVLLGIETVSESGLAEIKKSHNLNRDLMESVKRTQRGGLEVIGTFIVGLDNDTPEIFHQQMDFIQKSGIVQASVGTLNAYPGTQLYERLKAEHRLNKKPPGNRHTGETNIVPKMGLDALQSGLYKLLNTIYSPSKYCERVRIFLKDAKGSSIKISPMVYGRWTFFRMLIHLAIRQKGKKHHWKLLIWTIQNHPKMFAKVLKFAILGHHFQEFAESFDNIQKHNR